MSRPNRRVRRAAGPARSDELDGLTQQGRRSALQGILLCRDPSAYHGLQQDIFGHLDDDAYNNLSRTSTAFNALAVNKCSENHMNRILQNSPAYNGRCPNRHDRPPMPTSTRPCEGPQRQKEGQPVPIPAGTRHRNPHMVCNLCRKMFWKTVYNESLTANMRNRQRLRNLITFQQVSVCGRCNQEQRAIYSAPTNECSCYRDIRKSHWRCMHCTRHNIAVVEQESRWRRARLHYIRRDRNGQLRFNRRQSHGQAWCACDRGPAMAMTNPGRVRQCIRCEGYIVPRVNPNSTMRRSQRIRSRRLKTGEPPELHMLLNSRGSLRTAPIDTHGFPSSSQAR